MEPFPLNLVQGQSYRQRFVFNDVVAGVKVPRDLTALEVRGQVRSRGALVLDLTPHFTKHPGGVVGAFDLRLPGSVTRTVAKNASYDVFVSEVGIVDADSTRVLFGPVTVEIAQTASA